MRSRCLSPVGVDARTPGQLGFVGSARVASGRLIGSDLSSQSMPPLNTPTRKEHLCDTRFGVFGRPNSRTRLAHDVRPKQRSRRAAAISSSVASSRKAAPMSELLKVSSFGHRCVTWFVVLLGQPVRCSARAPPVAAVSGLHHQPAVAANGTLTRPCHSNEHGALGNGLAVLHDVIVSNRERCGHRVAEFALYPPPQLMKGMPRKPRLPVVSTSDGVSDQPRYSES